MIIVHYIVMVVYAATEAFRDHLARQEQMGGEELDHDKRVVGRLFGTALSIAILTFFHCKFGGSWTVVFWMLIGSIIFIPVHRFLFNRFSQRPWGYLGVGNVYDQSVMDLFGIDYPQKSSEHYKMYLADKRYRRSIHFAALALYTTELAAFGAVLYFAL